eukprot:1879780-Rhodomonas_salina.2
MPGTDTACRATRGILSLFEPEVLAPQRSLYQYRTFQRSLHSLCQCRALHGGRHVSAGTAYSERVARTGHRIARTEQRIANARLRYAPSGADGGDADGATRSVR